MIELEYEGRKYTNINGKWYYNNMEVSLSLQSNLNSALSEQESIEKLSLEELVDYADGYKKTESYLLAIKYYEKAINKYSIEENIRLNLPKLTSCYRLVNNPNKAIQLYEIYQKIYRNKIYSCALFTSVAAAYCDLNKFEVGKRYADRAYAMLKSSNLKTTEELMLVYQRIKKYI